MLLLLVPLAGGRQTGGFDRGGGAVSVAKARDARGTESRWLWQTAVRRCKRRWIGRQQRVLHTGILSPLPESWILTAGT